MSHFSIRPLSALTDIQEAIATVCDAALEAGLEPDEIEDWVKEALLDWMDDKR